MNDEATPTRHLDLMDRILEEGSPGKFRQLALANAKDECVDSLTAQGHQVIITLIQEGWLQEDEATLAQLPVEAALTSGQPRRWPIYLALNLDRVGIPLRHRGAFKDDRSLAAAVDAAAARNP